MIIKIWEGAPAWAKFCAGDFDGQWWFFRDRPMPGMKYRKWLGGGKRKKARVGPAPFENWRHVYYQR